MHDWTGVKSSGFVRNPSDEPVRPTNEATARLLVRGPAEICTITVYVWGRQFPVLRITFIDADGEKGVVDADLTLRYAGRHRDEMTAFVAEVGGESEHHPSLPISLLQRFAIGLYAEFPLAEVELVSEGREG